MGNKVKMTTKELTDRIYDTLLGNVGMSEYHVPLEPPNISYAEVIASEGKIYLQIQRKVYEITVTQTKSNHFRLYG